MSSLHREMMTKINPTRHLPPAAQQPTGSRGRKKKSEDFVPVSWNKYFDECKKIKVGCNTFNVYTLGNSGPLLLLLHGGGYSSLTWASFAKEISNLVECQILAIDLRGHGDTITTDDSDLSETTLSKDVSAVISTLYNDNPPPTIVMGHSMGGAIAVHATYSACLESVVALIVIDVVEGTAVDALTSMQSFLRSRPSSFNSVKEAISWSLFNGQVKNVEAAQVSVPGQIKNAESGVLAAFEEQSLASAGMGDASSSDEIDLSRPMLVPETIEENSADFKIPSVTSKQKYVWRIDLGKTEKYWRGWFQDLSSKFLECRAQKLLLLANIDRLDKDLTVGQMQGKFGMIVLNKVGHAVHEDEPLQVAEAVANFIVRNKFSTHKNNFR